MERVALKAESRATIGKQVRQMRREHQIPAVVYGHGAPALPIQADERSLSTALRTAGTTALIELALDDDPSPRLVLARSIQRNPLNGRLLHVDFYTVRLEEKVRTTPRLEFVGEPAIVRSGKAVLIHNMSELEVECLPTDLISSIRVDVSNLETMDDSIVVGDLELPAGVVAVANTETVVASIVPTRAAAEEVVEAPAAAAAAPSED